MREVAEDWPSNWARRGIWPVSTAEEDGKEEEGCNREDDGKRDGDEEGS